MTSSGQVRVWNDEEGWGVIDADVTPGGCWAHFSCLMVAGYRTLSAGQAVDFEFEVAQQDGFAFRAVAAWLSGRTPVHVAPETDPSSAYRSTVHITFGDEDQSRPS